MRDEKDYVKVTQVLSPFSGLHKIDPKVVKNAGIRGKRVHLACDLLVVDSNYMPDPDFPEDAGYVESFQKWYFDKVFIPKPPRFFCDDLMLTGECDMIYEDERGLVLVDLKTPLRESKTWLLQGSAYSYLAKREGYDIKAIEFVRLKKTGKEPQVISYQENFPLYKSCLDAYRYFFQDEVEEDYLDYL